MHTDFLGHDALDAFVVSKVTHQLELCARELYSCVALPFLQRDSQS